MEQHPHKSTTHKERYFHFQIPNHPKVKAATVFARHDGTSWGYAVAFCSIHDVFKKVVGRTQARRRYFQGGGTAFANMKGFSWASIEDPVYEEVRKVMLAHLSLMVKE